MTANQKWLVGLVCAVVVAVAAQAHTLPEPWDHIASMLGIAATAVTGYMIQRPQGEA